MTTQLITCLEDETLLRIFLTEFIGEANPLTLETSECLRTGFEGIDLRSMMLAGTEGDEQAAMAGGMAAFTMTLACLSEEEWLAIAPAMGMDPVGAGESPVPHRGTGRAGGHGPGTQRRGRERHDGLLRRIGRMRAPNGRRTGRGRVALPGTEPEQEPQLRRTSPARPHGNQTTADWPCQSNLGLSEGSGQFPLPQFLGHPFLNTLSAAAAPPAKTATPATASGAVIIAVSTHASGSIPAITTPRTRAAKAKTNHSPKITSPDRKTSFVQR